MKFLSLILFAFFVVAPVSAQVKTDGGSLEGATLSSGVRVFKGRSPKNPWLIF